MHYLLEVVVRSEVLVDYVKFFFMRGFFLRERERERERLGGGKRIWFFMLHIVRFRLFALMLICN